MNDHPSSPTAAMPPYLQDVRTRIEKLRALNADRLARQPVVERDDLHASLNELMTLIMLATASNEALLTLLQGAGIASAADYHRVLMQQLDTTLATMERKATILQLSSPQ